MWLSIFEPRGSGWGEVYMLHASNCLTSFLVRRATFRFSTIFAFPGHGCPHGKRSAQQLPDPLVPGPAFRFLPGWGHKKLEGFTPTVNGIFGSNFQLKQQARKPQHPPLKAQCCQPLELKKWNNYPRKIFKFNQNKKTCQDSPKVQALCKPAAHAQWPKTFAHFDGFFGVPSCTKIYPEASKLRQKLWSVLRWKWLKHLAAFSPRSCALIDKTRSSKITWCHQPGGTTTTSSSAW